MGKYLKGFVFGDWDNRDNRFEEALTWARSLPRDIWWCLETVLVVTLGKGGTAEYRTVDKTAPITENDPT